VLLMTVSFRALRAKIVRTIFYVRQTL